MKKNNKLVKLINDINVDNLGKFMKKFNLSLNDYRELEYCIQDLTEYSKTKTFVRTVSEVFEKYGFNCNLDNNKINYEIN